LPEKKLWPPNQFIVDETYIQPTPRFLWKVARQHYEKDDSLSAILMAGLAIESGVNEYASAWFNRKFGKEQTEGLAFLEASMDFRRTVELLWFVGAFTKELKDDLHKVYDSRNKYAHIQIMKIIKDTGEIEVQVKDSDGKPTRTIKFKEDEIFRMVGVIMNADDDAWEILKKTELCLERLFGKDESDYWKHLIWNIKEETKTQPAATM